MEVIKSGSAPRSEMGSKKARETVTPRTPTAGMATAAAIGKGSETPSRAPERKSAR